jgi:hypothetical protein
VRKQPSAFISCSVHSISQAPNIGRASSQGIDCHIESRLAIQRYFFDRCSSVDRYDERDATMLRHARQEEYNCCAAAWSWHVHPSRKYIALLLAILWQCPLCQNLFLVPRVKKHSTYTDSGRPLVQGNRPRNATGGSPAS